MTRSPDSLVPSVAGQPAAEKRDDEAFKCRQEGEANLRAATEVNAVSASLTPPVSRPIQLELFPGRACVPNVRVLIYSQRQDANSSGAKPRRK
jgi:hypothetical protein